MYLFRQLHSTYFLHYHNETFESKLFPDTKDRQFQTVLAPGRYIASQKHAFSPVPACNSTAYVLKLAVHVFLSWIKYHWMFHALSRKSSGSFLIELFALHLNNNPSLWVCPSLGSDASVSAQAWQTLLPSVALLIHDELASTLVTCHFSPAS